MDPNVALHDLREAVNEAANPDQYTDMEIVAEKITEAFDALDGWLSRGGALPEEWGQRAPEPTVGENA